MCDGDSHRREKLGEQAQKQGVLWVVPFVSLACRLAFVFFLSLSLPFLVNGQGSFLTLGRLAK
jgi:hypothetical protein